MFRRILRNLRENKRRYFGLFVLVSFALAVFVVPETAYAAKSVREVIAEIASWLVHMITLFLWLIIALTGPLMENHYIMDGSIGEVLHLIWLVIRNLVNVGFVVLLLGAAFYMVMSPGGEGNTMIKDKLPNFVLAMILVNFSWLGVQVILDASNVATAAVFAIPQSVGLEKVQCYMPTHMKPGETKKEFTARKIKEHQDAEKKFSEGQGPKPISSMDAVPCYEVESIEILDVKRETDDIELTAVATNKLTANEKVTVVYSDRLKLTYKALTKERGFNAQNALTILATNVGNIQNMPQMSLSVKDIAGFSINTVFSLVMIFIIGVPILCLFIVLIGRIVSLWISIALMPLAFLGLAMKGTLTSQIVEGMEMPDVVSMFIKNAFLPAFAAAPLSIGFLMLNAGLASDMATTGIPNFTFAEPIAGIEEGQRLLWHILTAGIIWVGFFSAIKGQEITGSIVEKIKGGAEGLGTWLGTAPFKYVTFIPMLQGKPGDKAPRLSLGDLYKLPTLVSDKLDTASRDRLSQYFEKGIEPSLAKDENKKLELARTGNFKGISKANQAQLKERYEHLLRLAKSPDTATSEKGIKELAEHIKQFRSGAGMRFDYKKADNIEAFFHQMFKGKISVNMDRLKKAGLFSKVATHLGGVDAAAAKAPKTSSVRMK